MSEYLKKIRQAGRRLTKVRRVILQYLLGQSEPQTAAAIHHGLGRFTVDLASVYRTLELLARLGVVSREPQGNPSAYVLADRHHHHIVCRSCRRQNCLPCAVKLPPPRGFSAVQHQVIMSGVCAACAAR